MNEHIFKKYFNGKFSLENKITENLLKMYIIKMQHAGLTKKERNPYLN
jgi:hypothetical protein